MESGPAGRGRHRAALRWRSSPRPGQATPPAEQPLPADLGRKLRAGPGAAVSGRSVLPGGLRASVARTRRRLRAEWRRVDGPGAAWRFVRWCARAVLRRMSKRLRAARPGPAPAALGVEIAARGARARAVLQAAGRGARPTPGSHIDMVAADTAAEAAGAAAGAAVPAVVLAEAPPLLSVPAFDPRTDNPIGWWPVERGGVAALGPLDRLPPGCRADRVVRRADRAALRRARHLEDAAAFHADPATRAGDLVRLAATGVVVHLADGDRRLAPYVGAELFELMTSAVRDLGLAGREALGARMRRAALREHSVGSRARQFAERALADPPRLPLVSILLATRRPELLAWALAAVRRQTYPRLELILGLHGEGFGEVAPGAAGPAVPVTALRLDAALPLGSVLNAATQAARGTLLAKMDDDDLYGPDHLWDLVLAHEYSQAPLVGKAAEFVYLAASNRTVRRPQGSGGERFDQYLGGGALLVARHMLDRVGGWKRSAKDVDSLLIDAVERAGHRPYRTHPYGYLMVRHGRRHTWVRDDADFLAQADVAEAGWRPELAGLAGAQPPDRLLGRTAGGFAGGFSVSQPKVRAKHRS